MNLFALGLNHQSASIALRERVAFSSDIIGPAAADLSRQEGLYEAFIISTCNRTELYFTGESHAEQTVGVVKRKAYWGGRRDVASYFCELERRNEVLRGTDISRARGRKTSGKLVLPITHGSRMGVRVPWSQYD